MNLPDFNISGNLHNRWCRFIIQRYLGQFLERNLSLDQLSVEITSGFVEVKDVNLNVQYVNEQLSNLGLPLTLVDGFVGKIAIEVPWKNLLATSTKLKIDELQITFAAREGFSQEYPEAVASMMNSLNPRELARSFCEDEEEEVHASGLESQDGIQAFTKVIDAIAAKFCCDVSNLTIRFENPSNPQTDMCTAMEIRVKEIKFMDEQMRNAKEDGCGNDAIVNQPTGVGNITNLNKYIHISGVELFTDVFSRIDELNFDDANSTSQVVTSMYIRREKMKQQLTPTRSTHESVNPDLFLSMASTTSNFESCHSQLPRSEPAFQVTKSEKDLLSNPIKFAEISGNTEVVIRVLNASDSKTDNEEIKFDVEVRAKGVNSFLTPSQTFIFKSFFDSLSLTPEVRSHNEMGKPMEACDYEALARRFELENMSSIKAQQMTMQGNWVQHADFCEFDSISLEDHKSQKKSSEVLGGYKSLRNEEDKRSCTTLKVTIGTIMFYIAHDDIMSAENARQTGHHETVDKLMAASEEFFDRASRLHVSATTPLNDLRTKADELYAKNHLRLLGSNVNLVYQTERGSGVRSTTKFVVTNFDCLEYLTPESNPFQAEIRHFPLFDFSEFDNKDHVPHLKVVYETAPAKNTGQIYLGHCRVELDLSIVDRIADLINPRPFFINPSFGRARMDSFGRKFKRKMPELSGELFTVSSLKQSILKTWFIDCEKLTLDLRVPIADLRNTNACRLPYNQRNVHPEFVRLQLSDAHVEIPIHEDFTNFKLQCNELLGDFLGVPDTLDISRDELRFLYATKSSMEKKINITFTYDTRNKSLESSGDSHIMNMKQDDMTKSFSATLFQAQPKRDGPFSKTKRSFENDEEIVQPGSRKEMEDFTKETLKISKILVQFNIPIIRLLLANHEYLEILYNRLVNDLALWKPAAPSLCAVGSDVNVNALAEQFEEYSAFERDEEDEVMEPQTVDGYNFDRHKPHLFSLLLNVKQGDVLLGTVVKENGMDSGPGQVGIKLEDAQFFTVAGYHDDINHIFLHFTSKSVAIGNRNFNQFGERGTVNKTIEQKDFARFQKDEIQMQTIPANDPFNNPLEDDSFGVALHMHSRPDINVKDILVAIGFRNIQVKARPFRDSGHLWYRQIADMFTLQDYGVPGYELPQTTNDIQLHMSNVVVAYDHCWIKPSSPSRLRLVFGETHISNSLIYNMEVSRLSMIFETARLYMSTTEPKVRFEPVASNKKAVANPTDDSFVRIVDVGLFHLEFLFSMVGEEKMNVRKTPVFEIACKNDIIKAWACADSLVAFLNLVTEITQSDAFTPIPVVEPKPDEDDFASTCDDTRSEACASLWSAPSSLAKPTTNSLPEDKQERMMHLLNIAQQEMQSTSDAHAIPVGKEALEEFSQDYSLLSGKSGSSMDHHNDSNDFMDDHHVSNDRLRAYSLPTDDEFCMVDDVIGSGITNATGEPMIKHISTKTSIDDPVIINSQHFQFPNEWRADGLGALIGNDAQAPPILRYMVKDLSVQLHIYGGSDLDKREQRIPSYSTDEYRQGMGRGQLIKTEEKGGSNRDHSVSVVLDLSKITFLYQVYDKDAPAKVTTLFSINDIVMTDRVFISNIDKMLYQYSNSEQPRRTYAPMMSMKSLVSQTNEGRMRCSMLPIKLNLDQDTVNFLEDFVADVVEALRLPGEVASAVANRPMIEVPAEVQSAASRKQSKLKMPPHNLNVEPLTPSPIMPPSPLGDLSYLDRPHDSPIKRPLIEDPMHNVGSTSFLAPREEDEDDYNDSPSHSPDFIVEQRGASPQFESTPSELSDNLFDMPGDWKDSDDIDYDCLNASSPKTDRRNRTKEIDDFLARSTMDGSIHQSMIEEELIDTRGDQQRDENDSERSTICDDDDNTQMEASDVRAVEDEEALQSTTFYKEFIFSPAVSIHIDYHGKNKIAMEKGGALLGILRGIAQLNGTELVLKEFEYRNGLLGVGRCVNHAFNVWAEDLAANLPNVITSCGPISPLVQIGKGFMDLLWMPVAELQKEDGHVVKGFQKGIGSFGVSSAAGIVGISQTFVGMLQSLAETVLHEVQPDVAYQNRRSRRPISRNTQPTDIRHGMQRVVGIIHEGYQMTREDFMLASDDGRRPSGSSFRNILRVLTPAILRPIVMTTHISYQMLGGIRNQLRPDMYQDEMQKWKKEKAIPGSM